MVQRDIWVIYDEEDNIETFADESDIDTGNMRGYQVRLIKISLTLPKIRPINVKVEIGIEDETRAVRVLHLKEGQ